MSVRASRTHQRRGCKPTVRPPSTWRLHSRHKRPLAFRSPDIQLLGPFFRPSSKVATSARVDHGPFVYEPGGERSTPQLVLYSHGVGRERLREVYSERNRTTRIVTCIRDLEDGKGQDDSADESHTLP